MTRYRRGRRWSNVALVVGLAAWILVPLSLGGFLFYRANDVQVVAPKQVWATPELSTEKTQSRVGLALTWTTPPVAVAPAWDGVVQNIKASVGTRLKSGDTFAKIQGIDRILLTTPEPFVRPLGLGMKGEDVRSLNEFLKSRNLQHGVGDNFSRTTREGVRALAKLLGAGDDVAVFDPGWVIFLPREVTVKELSVNVGAPAPTAGTALFEASTELASAKLIESGVADKLAQGNEVPVPQPQPLPEGLEVVVAEDSLQLDEDRMSIAATSLPRLQGILAPDAKATVVETTSLTESEGWVLPSVALYIDRNGASCVLVHRDGETHGVVATVKSVQGASSVVQAALLESDRIGMDPSVNPRPCE